MIVSRNNADARTLRRLRNAHSRRRSDLLLLEGPHLVGAAADAGLEFQKLLATPEFRTARAEALRGLEARSGTAATIMHADRLRDQADADAPQGVAALAAPPAVWRSAGKEENRADKEAGRALPLRSGLHLHVDGVQDPGNLGALARSAEAAGAAALLLSPGTARPHQPRALRASAGSLLRLPLWTGARADHVPANARRLALVPDPPAHCSPGDGERPIASIFAAGEPDRRLVRLLAADPIVLSVGGESRGISSPVLERADLLLTVPTAGAVESLNAAVAASLALFELRRLRTERAERPDPRGASGRA